MFKVRPSIEAAERIFILETVVYSAAPTGEAHALEPQPELRRAFYVPRRADLQHMLSQAHGILPVDNVSFFCVQRDQGNERSGFFLEYKKTVPIVLEYGIQKWARSYEVKGWREFDNEKEFGFLVTGSGGASLWRIVRAEADHMNRAKLTLRAVNPSSGFPGADFSSVQDPDLRIGLGKYWENLQKQFTDGHENETVTAAKNVVEGLLVHILSAASQQHTGTLNEKLDRIGKALEADPRSAPIGRLEYHLAQKLRLLHQLTHPERAAQLDQALRPEFTLGCVEDLIQILSATGYLRR